MTGRPAISPELLRRMAARRRVASIARIYRLA